VHAIDYGLHIEALLMLFLDKRATLAKTSREFIIDSCAFLYS